MNSESNLCQSIVKAEQFTCRHEGGTKDFGPFEFEIKKGDFVGLIGPNGAGKTTMIRSALQIGAKSNHKLKFFGRDSVDIQESLQRVFYLPEKVAFLKHLTGNQNAEIVLGRKLQGSNFISHCKELGIFDDLNRSVSQYSKGMTQKLGIACAFAAGAELMILDEPMSGLDPDSRLKVRDMILRERSSKGFLVSSHLHTDLISMSTHVLVISEGKQKWWSSLSQFLEFLDRYRVLRNIGGSLVEEEMSRTQVNAFLPADITLVEPAADSLSFILEAIERRQC